MYRLAQIGIVNSKNEQMTVVILVEYISRSKTLSNRSYVNVLILYLSTFQKYLYFTEVFSDLYMEYLYLTNTLFNKYFQGPMLICMHVPFLL